MVEITAPFEDISLSVGVHPNETLSHDEEPDANTLLNLATHDRVVAIGETGLDYFRSEGALDWQRDRFCGSYRSSENTTETYYRSLSACRGRYGGTHQIRGRP